jgi:hypothetical protein
MSCPSARHVNAKADPDSKIAFKWDMIGSRLRFADIGEFLCNESCRARHRQIDEDRNAVFHPAGVSKGEALFRPRPSTAVAGTPTGRHRRPARLGKLIAALSQTVKTKSSFGAPAPRTRPSFERKPFVGD